MNSYTSQENRPLVLLVDDSPTVLQALNKSLRHTEFIFAEARSGAEALALFSQRAPDIVLLDVMMPEMDGFETCIALRRLPGGAHTPIIMLTSLDDIESITRAYEVGATDFITKPIKPILLHHRLRYMLRADRALRKLAQSKEALSQAHADLELRVAERTLALQCSTEQLQREIYERERAEEELRDAHTQFRSLLENSPLAIVEWDAHWRIKHWSPQAELIFGWQKQEVLGKRYTDWQFVPPDELEMVKNVETSLCESNTARNISQNRNYRKDGRLIECEWYNSALRDEQGQIVSVLSLVQDITARREAERIKEELVSTVSHELRTPLASLRGFTELMLNRNFPRAKQQEFLSIMHSESLRLTNLINDFLDIQRMESNRQVYHFEAISLSAFVHETAALFTTTDSTHQFCLDFPTEIPLVRADHDSFRQVLTNLLSNAIKFSPQGGVVTVSAQLSGKEVVLSVADQGIGIPKEALPKLFGKFFRVDNQETRDIGGTGLGLALIKKIIEAHGGRVWVESTVGKGSTFFFSLPVMIQHASTADNSNISQTEGTKVASGAEEHRRASDTVLV